MSADLRIVYIAGRGHSGTTFLDVLLGNARNVESFGELVSGLSRGLGEACSCGESLGDCEFWTEVRHRYRAAYDRDLIEDGRWLYRHSDVRRFTQAWRADSTEGGWSAEYVRLNNAIFKTLSEVSGCAVLVDSNKEFTRALAILRGSELSKVIHLHRDAVAVIGSYYYRQTKGMPLKFMKREFHPRHTRFLALTLPALGWSVGMILGWVLKLRFADRVLNVSYERLCLDPRMELQRIADFASMDLDTVIEGVENRAAFPVGHNIGGNELRHDGSFTFIPNVHGRRKIPWPYRLMTRLLALPGMAVRRLQLDRR